MVEQAPPATGHRSRTCLVVQGLLSLVLVVAIFYFLRRKIDPAQTWAAITAMTWLELATLGLLAIWNLCTYAFVWMSVTPGLGFWRAMVMTQATTAVANTVPAGSAIGIGMTYTMLGSWGYSRSRTTTAVLVSGVWNSFIKLGMPVLALALVALQGGATGGRVVAAVLGIAGLVAAAVLVYRALTWALPILVGIGSYLWWRRRSWTTSPQNEQHVAGATVTAGPDRQAKG